MKHCANCGAPISPDSNVCKCCGTEYVPKTHKCSKVKKNCFYAVSFTSGEYMCDYIGIEGHRRGCPPEQCDKYKRKCSRRKTVSEI